MSIVPKQVLQESHNITCNSISMRSVLESQNKSLRDCTFKKQLFVLPSCFVLLLICFSLNYLAIVFMNEIFICKTQLVNLIN